MKLKSYNNKQIYWLVGLIFISLLIIKIGGDNFQTIFIISVIWLIYIGIFIKSLAKLKNKKWLIITSKIYNVLIFIFIITFILLEIFLCINIINFKEAKDIENLEYIIVLGAGLDGDNVGNTLKSRLDKVIEYKLSNGNTQVIVSGGQGKDEVISEAEAMKRYLIKNGIKENQIIKEDKSTTTLENIKFSKSILKDRNDENEKVLIVTNDFHLTRARIIANLLGIKSEGLASQTPIRIKINYLVREYPTMIIDLVRTSIYALNN